MNEFLHRIPGDLIVGPDVDFFTTLEGPANWGH